MRTKYDGSISEWIDKNREQILEDWISICKIPAIKGEPTKTASFGKECAKALEVCTGLFENRGFKTRIYEKSGYSLVSFGEGVKTIGLFSHSDVVPAGEGWIYTNPFEPIVKNGALIGRGVSDNKSGIMASLCAMEIIRKYNIPIKSRIQLFIGSNEESGMEDISAFVKEQPMPEVSLVPDAEFPCCTGEKGICHLYAQSGEGLFDIVDFCGGNAFNIILDKAAATLKYSKKLEMELGDKIKNKPELELKAEGDKIIVYAKGIAAHASEPKGSVNAAYILAQLLSEIETLSQSDRKIMKEAEHILACPFGTTMGIDHCDDLFGRLTFANGIAEVSDGRLRLSFDMRYSSALNSEELVQRTRIAFEKLGWEISVKEKSDGFAISADSKLPSMFERIYKEVTGVEKKSFKIGGGTYARHLKNAFSVGTEAELSNYKIPRLKMPAGHGGCHQCDEMIDLEGFFTAVRIIVHYLIAMDEEINK